MITGTVPSYDVAYHRIRFSVIVDACFDAASRDKAQKCHHEAHVYLMRGLMNIFSLGMDQLASTVALGVLCFALAAGSSSNLAAAGIAAAQPRKCTPDNANTEFGAGCTRRKYGSFVHFPIPRFPMLQGSSP